MQKQKKKRVQEFEFTKTGFISKESELKKKIIQNPRICNRIWIQILGSAPDSFSSLASYNAVPDKAATRMKYSYDVLLNLHLKAKYVVVKLGNIFQISY